MSNRDILNWWDNLGIAKCINLREKYGYSEFAALDVDDYRDIYVENAGTRPVYNVKLHARKSQETNLIKILDKKIIGSRKYEKIETPEEWKKHNTVIDYMLIYSTELTGEAIRESSYLLLIKPK